MITRDSAASGPKAEGAHMRSQLVFAAVAAVFVGSVPAEAVDPVGAVPSGPVVVVHGSIYGATEYGGPNCPRRSNLDVAGCGTVYKADADGTLTALHAFAGDDGANPSSGLAAGPDGMLYGTTDAGGASGHGVIYRIATDGTSFAVLYAFTNGAEHGTLTVGADGTMYGVAPPSHGDGHGASVFALSRSGEFRTLRVFGPETHVAAPLAIDEAGQLYGIVIRGGYCGAEVFSLSGTGAYGVVFSNSLPYEDPGCAKTAIPTSPLVDDEGTLYATGGRALYSVGRDGIKAVYVLPPVEKPIPGPTGSFEGIFIDGTLTAAPDGSIAAAVTPSSFRSNAGARIVRFDPSTADAFDEHFPGDVGFYPAPTGRGTPDSLAYASGMLYGVTGQGARCTKGPTLRFCGAFVGLASGEAHIIATFDPPDPVQGLWREYPSTARFQLAEARLPGHLSMSMQVESPSTGPFFARTATSTVALRPVGAPHGRPVSLTFERDVWTLRASAEPTRWASGELSLHAPAIPSGMYDVDLSRFHPIVSDADGYAVMTDLTSTLPVYIPPAPASTPALRVGQRFIGFTQPAGVPPTSAPDMAIRTLETIAPIASGGYHLTFALDDGGTESRDVASADVFGLDGLEPIVEDPDVDALSKKYGGRDVFSIGDFAPMCVLANGMLGGENGGHGVVPSSPPPLHIRSIVRLYGVSAVWGIGPDILRTLDSAADYVTSSPILVVFDGPRADGLLTGPPFAGRSCAAAYAEFSGSWDFERALSSRSIVSEHPEWDAKTLDAVAKHDVGVGMTRAMVIASVGYPSDYGTAAQLMKSDIWHYELPAPSAYTIRFKGDTVVKYDPPGQLP